MPFETPLSVTYTDGHWARLDCDLVYKGKYDRFVVPAGFETDFATVPWWGQSFIPRTGKWTKAAVVHDFLLQERKAWFAAREEWLAGRMSDGEFAMLPEPLSSRNIDGIFRRILREQGVGVARRWIMWAGVRWGALFSKYRREGWWHWHSAPGTLAISSAAATAVGSSWWAVHVFVDWIWPW